MQGLWLAALLLLSHAYSGSWAGTVARADAPKAHTAPSTEQRKATTKAGDGGSAARELFLTFRAQAITKKGTIVAIDEESVLHEGDRIWFEVQASAASYLHMLQITPGGDVGVLYPVDGVVKLARGQSVRIPRSLTAYFKLDDEVGTERVVIIATSQPVEKSDARLAKLIEIAREQRRWPKDSELSPEQEKTKPASKSSGKKKTKSRQRAATTSTKSEKLASEEDIQDEIARFRERYAQNMPSSPQRGLSLDEGGPQLELRPDEDGVAVAVFEFEHAQ